jgi:hypothetical protein
MMHIYSNRRQRDPWSAAAGASVGARETAHARARRGTSGIIVTVFGGAGRHHSYSPCGCGLLLLLWNAAWSCRACWVIPREKVVVEVEVRVAEAAHVPWPLPHRHDITRYRSFRFI